jgi:polar amino acid transport system substrate-binding protein
LNFYPYLEGDGLILRLLLWAFIGVFSSFSLVAEPLRLVYPYFPPYTQAPQGATLSAGNFLVDQIMRLVGVDYQSSPVPNYKRALSDVKKGMADGFFLASKNDQRDAVAVFSEPVVFNHWSWFFNSEMSFDSSAPEFKQQARVASIEGTNTLRWLKDQGYQVVGKQTEVDSLAQLLFDLKRIDAVFISADVFKYGSHHPRLADGSYLEVIEQRAPFGIYISKNYLQQYPDFMVRLNIAIQKVKQTYLAAPYTLSSLK